MTIIPTPETITPRWLTERLREAGHTRATVADVTATRIGTGQIGKCIRFTMEVSGGDASTPRSLVGKFPSDDPTSRATGVALRNFRKEVCFYRHLQPRLKISTPRCYFAAIDGDGPDFLLLLEDLAPAKQGDQLAGTSIPIARTAVAELVGLHAPTWCDASLRGLEWLGEPAADSIEMVRGMYAAQLPGFLERYRGQLEPDEARIIAQVAESKGPPFQPLQDVYSVVHVDYRLDNLLIDGTRTPVRVSVVDWQTVTLGSPLSDVAYFLGAGLDPGDRRRAERDIVRVYHEGLLAAGVRGYDFERCWDDYRRGVFAGFVVTVIAAMIVQRTERGDRMFLSMARRHSRHALDLGAQDLLG
ncbi:MAG TPA: phosphotransferase [Candidatus Limnocylindrales bacterium]|nr:phosphotransferase [Candidatus Limnocylindrales bacterium]